MARCDTYAPGQCTAGACAAAAWVPDGLGNGGSWAANARARGYTVTAVPTVGSIVCYCAGDGYSQFGHVALVTAVYGDGTFEVHEMNFVAAYTYDDRRSNQYDVCGFILPPGTSPGQGAPLGQGAGGGAPSLQVPGEIVSMWEQIRQLVNTDWPAQAAYATAIAGLVQRIGY